MKTDLQLLNKTGYQSSVIWSVLDCLFPPFCCDCGKLGCEICPDCWKKIAVINQNLICPICGDISPQKTICASCGSNTKPAFFQMRSWGIYSGVLKKAIQRLKFERGFGVIPYLIPVCVEFISSLHISIDLIIPVPLSKKRLKERGYNQSDLIANSISKRLGMPYSLKSLTRIKSTRSQVGLNAMERAENVLNAFEGNPELLKDRSVLLIDDITTTGSTINESSKALMTAGAKRVYCFTIARTPIQSEEY